MTKNAIKIPIERIEKTIYVIRSEKVILDRDLAELYEVETKALNRRYAAIAIGFLRISCFS